MFQGSYIPTEEQQQQKDRSIHHHQARPRSLTEQQQQQQQEVNTDRIETIIVGIGATFFAGALNYALYISSGCYSLTWIGLMLIGPVLIIQASCSSTGTTTAIEENDDDNDDANELTLRRCPNCDLLNQLVAYDHWRSSSNRWIKMVRCRKCGYHGHLDDCYDARRRYRIPLMARKICSMILQRPIRSTTTTRGDRSEEQRGLILFGKLSSSEEEETSDDDSDDDDIASLSFGSVMVL